jgi:hypothetical protein
MVNPRARFRPRARRLFVQTLMPLDVSLLDGMGVGICARQTTVCGLRMTTFEVAKDAWGG